MSAIPSIPNGRELLLHLRRLIVQIPGGPPDITHIDPTKPVGTLFAGMEAPPPDVLDAAARVHVALLAGTTPDPMDWATALDWVVSQERRFPTTDVQR